MVVGSSSGEVNVGVGKGVVLRRNITGNRVLGPDVILLIRQMLWELKCL